MRRAAGGMPLFGRAGNYSLTLPLHNMTKFGLLVRYQAPPNIEVRKIGFILESSGSTSGASTKHMSELNGDQWHVTVPSSVLTVYTFPTGGNTLPASIFGAGATTQPMPRLEAVNAAKHLGLFDVGVGQNNLYY